MSDLCSIDRVMAQIPSATDANRPLVAALITAASSVIETHCNRVFAKATYDVVLNGTGTAFLFLDNPPISRIISIRSGRLPAIQLQYSDPGNQTQFANVEVTSTGLTLAKMYNGTPTTNEFPFTAYPQFAALGAAINELAGWKATVSPQFELWNTADLYIPNANTGAFNARNYTVNLSVYWNGLPSYRVDAELGEVYKPGGFTPGFENYRVQYVGGYADVPDEIQQACAELVQLTFATRNANPLMQSETLDKYSYTRAAAATSAIGMFDQLSATSKMALSQYKIHRVASNGSGRNY